MCIHMESSNSTLLQPGVSIKPEIMENDVNEILRKVYGFKCVSIKELNGYDDKNYHVKVENTYDNIFIEHVNPAGYIFKVVNSLDSKKPHLFEAQNELLLHSGRHGICCPKPVQDKSGQYQNIIEFSSGKHIIRLLEFIEGLILHQVSPPTNFFYNVGKYLGQLDEALKTFSHSAYENHKIIWHLESIPQLLQFVYVVNDPFRKNIVEEVIKEFIERVLPVSHKMEKGMIHGDFNEQNILVEQKDNTWVVKGVLDFGDSNFSCYLYELAIAMTYMMIQGKTIDIGGYVLAGYNSVRKLPSEELSLLKVCIAGRLCQSLVLGAYSSLQDPNNSYILTTAKAGWALLEELWKQPEQKLFEQWKTKEYN